MTGWEGMLAGFAIAFSAQNLLYCFIGCVVGTAVGVLPGIGPAGALAMLLPATVALPPVTAIIMMAGIYYGAMYGGSTTAILINIPGEAAAVVTTLDGYQLARQGRAGPALAIAALASFVAGTLAVIGLTLVAPPLAELALAFQSPEYVALILLGLTLLAYVSAGSTLQALMTASAGLLLGAVGAEPMDGIARMTFDLPGLLDGFGLVPVMVGLFGIAEVLDNLRRRADLAAATVPIGSLMPTRGDLRTSTLPTLRGSSIGFFVGLLPGGNAIIAALMAYAIERRIAREPARFGAGAIEGVAAPEAANNAASVSSFVPLLTFGVPTNAVVALLLAALLIHNVVPGPQLITRHPEVFWGTIASMHIGNAMLLALNLPLVGLWVRLVRMPYPYLFPLVLAFCLLGAYTVGGSIFDVAVAIGFGVLGYAMKRTGFEPAPLVLAYVLGPMFEENLRRTLIVSNGAFSVFFDRPIALGLVLCSVAVVVLPLALPAVRRAVDAAKSARE